MFYYQIWEWLAGWLRRLNLATTEQNIELISVWQEDWKRLQFFFFGPLRNIQLICIEATDILAAEKEAGRNRHHVD